MSSQTRESKFAANGIELAAKEWGEEGQTPVLALHGWLDNCASFDVLAPLLENVHLIALDLAGHGLSGHRTASAPYQIWEDVGDILDVADQLGWKEFALLGHSRGAIISTLFAGTFPERISHLALIDGLWPMPVEAEQAPKQLAESILALRPKRERRIPLYPDKNAAIEARRLSRVPVTKTVAALLVERGVKEVEGGYTWTSDPRLLLPSAMKLTSSHCRAFLDRVSAKTQFVLARDGMPTVREYYINALEDYPHISVSEIAGSHHLHMEDSAVDVAKVLNHFLHN